MGDWVTCTTDDGHELSAYLANSGSESAPGIVVLQEIFGVTVELTELAEKLSDKGFRVVVPALYDRIRPDCVIDYEQSELARATKNQLRYDEIQCDIKAAIGLANEGRGVALLGFCWGGGLAYWMAQSFSVDAVVSYYGTALAQYCRAPPPKAPCLFHFGRDDTMIDQSARDVVKASCKSGDRYFEYVDAGHAFANSGRSSYRQAQAQLADERTLFFLAEVFLKHNR